MSSNQYAQRSVSSVRPKHLPKFNSCAEYDLLLTMKEETVTNNNNSNNLGRLRFYRRGASTPPIMLSPKRVAQPNPSCSAQCRQDTTSPWTSRPKTISNDFGCFWIQLADSNSIFVVAEIFLLIFLSFGVQSHATRLHMSTCCGLFAPTIFHFERCCVRDDS